MVVVVRVIATGAKAGACVSRTAAVGAVGVVSAAAAGVAVVVAQVLGRRRGGFGVGPRGGSRGWGTAAGGREVGLREEVGDLWRGMLGFGQLLCAEGRGRGWTGWRERRGEGGEGMMVIHARVLHARGARRGCSLCCMPLRGLGGCRWYEGRLWWVGRRARVL